MDLFFVQGFSFLGFLKNLGFVGYVLLFLHSRYAVVNKLVKYSCAFTTREDSESNELHTRNHQIAHNILKYNT